VMEISGFEGIVILFHSPGGCADVRALPPGYMNLLPSSSRNGIRTHPRSPPKALHVDIAIIARVAQNSDPLNRLCSPLRTLDQAGAETARFRRMNGNF